MVNPLNVEYGITAGSPPGSDGVGGIYNTAFFIRPDYPTFPGGAGKKLAIAFFPAEPSLSGPIILPTIPFSRTVIGRGAADDGSVTPSL